ncbi:helix-turn-helix domain-containing protein [Denitromonas halophila]|uniref:Helix-turn-helix domain-containing protein n=1 Tax=Denitromonas halophila TaxID=1629404 RepID=A0A557QXC5_9RHOO|nr:helix-turn-helix domain-containing protein [Denitromonas halophila]TVO57568.1 helix-turn-helix domain-containing protein [Denitromonas halophila]
MTRRNWKRIRARSLIHAMELCLEHARAKHNLSIDRVCDLMGEHSTSTVYKWLATGRLPAVRIRPFEHACGATYVSEYLAASAHLLAIRMPTGRPADETDVMELQAGFSDALALLIHFYKGEADAASTLAALDTTLAAVAWHRANVERTGAPELSLFEGGDDE